MNAIDEEDAKAGKRAGNYGVCKEEFLLSSPHPKKSNYLSVIMTSNLGSSTIVELCAGEEEVSTKALIEAIRPELSAHFQPALLARCKMIPFRPLAVDVMRGVVAIKLDKIAQRIKKAHGITLSCSPELVDTIAQNCTAIERDARNADAVIDQALLPGISRQLLLHLGEEDKTYTRVHIGSTPEGDFEIIFARKAMSFPRKKRRQASEALYS